MPSPQPKRIFEIRVVEWLVDRGVVVICTGGGGIPTMLTPDGVLVGVDAVIDKDHAGGLLARSLRADVFLMLTDAVAVWAGWGSPHARPIRCASPEAIEGLPFAEGSMGPKVKAACDFARATGGRAGIGALEDAVAIVESRAGTVISAEYKGISYWPSLFDQTGV